MYQNNDYQTSSRARFALARQRVKTQLNLLTGITITLILCTNTSLAHEFWLQPSSQQLTAPGSISLELRNGEHFLGHSLPLQPDDRSRFDVASVRNSTVSQAPVVGTEGDIPAIGSWTLERGFHIFRYESDAEILQHPDFASFETFASEEGLFWAADAHKQRGLSEHRVTEQFRRFAKTLIAVDTVEGFDYPSGLELELVALNNPYSQSTVDLPIQVLYQGTPLAGAQVSIFHRSKGDLNFRKLETDQQGLIRLPNIQSGNYLLSAVHLRPTSTKVMIETQAVWESLWSSLTFEVSET